MSSRTYQRRLQCEAACALFVTLVRDATTDMFEHIAATGADLATIASRLPAARVEPSPDNAGALPARRPPTHTS
jgi:hypothetical protein